MRAFWGFFLLPIVSLLGLRNACIIIWGCRIRRWCVVGLTCWTSAILLERRSCLSFFRNFGKVWSAFTILLFFRRCWSFIIGLALVWLHLVSIWQVGRWLLGSSTSRIRCWWGRVRAHCLISLVVVAPLLVLGRVFSGFVCLLVLILVASMELVMAPPLLPSPVLIWLVVTIWIKMTDKML